MKRRRGRNPNRKKRDKKWFERKPDMLYFEAVITDTLPGVKFIARVDRGPDLEPLMLKCDVKSCLKVKRVKIIKGDKVWLEIDPKVSLTHGVIVSRQ